MTKQVCFVEKGKVKLLGDPKGFLVSTNSRNQFWDWCYHNNMKPEYQGTLGGQDLWYMKNEEHRTMAILKWQ